ncbi:transketolase [Oribacterium sp. HCP28S3_H8]|uniref:transketolase n=1 Tax=Oribacterium sp. HCP28S3_H8 TaxID=3438945 RepID=UPI003F8C1C6A
MEKEKKEYLDSLCLEFRKTLIRTLHAIQTGHPGGSLSVCEILTDLYFNDANISPENMNDRSRDKIILCKGHAAPMLYINLAKKGFFPMEELKTLRQINSRLQGHPCTKETPGVEASTGPLGAGYPLALGVALADMHDGIDAYTYAILGDGEINEGVVWETAMNASKFHANRLITILDWNGVQLDGTNEEIMPMGDVALKFKAFGYNTIEVDGHDVSAISAAIEVAKTCKDRPTIILAHTVKGKGISFMEGDHSWHGKAIDDAHYEQAMKELGGEA